MDNEYIISIPPSQSDSFAVSISGITYENPGYRISRSNMPIYVVEYVISGTGYIELNNQIYTASAGDMYIIPPNSKHTYYSDSVSPWRKIWFNSSGILLNELLRIYSLDKKILYKNADGYKYLKKILSICENKTLSGDEISKQCSIILFELILFLHEHESLSDKENPTEAELLKSYIDMNIDKAISIAELSGHIFRSESQTMRIFKNAYNQTPYDYLLSQKILRSNLFLLNTGMPIKEIAQRLGFCDEHYFSTLYKKKTGITPSEYRKKHTLEKSI